MTSVGLAAKLARLGVHTWSDLAYLIPRGYQDRSVLPLIHHLPMGEPVVAYGRITGVSEEWSKHRVHLLKVAVCDESGMIQVVFFNQAYLKPVLKVGLEVVITGKTEKNPYTLLPQLVASELDVIRSPQDRQQLMGCVVPIYPLTAGLYQSKLRALIQYVLTQLVPHLPDCLPLTLRQGLNLMPLALALQTIHQPPTLSDVQPARMRLVFDEFLRYQLTLLQRRHLYKRVPTTCHLHAQSPLHDAYITHLPYQLTNAQWGAIRDIEQDIASGLAMNRLIQGDVGSGKTEVIVMAMLMAIDAGYSAALMAPTDVLASQHYRKLSGALSRIGVDTVLLKGSLTSRSKQRALTRLADPTPLVAVGTHALIQDPVRFHQLGLVVIDEQHRFGVEQRLRLVKKGAAPHCLYTTATPIPRTFMLTLYGELDKSLITEMPPGRTPPRTIRYTASHWEQVVAHMMDCLGRGEQLYVVYPLIEASSKMDLASAIEGHALIQTQLPHHTVGLLHGKLPAHEKDQLMADFQSGAVQVLVSTTVIEVGVDVANATMMVIMNAERFGLSQLHQLRGRVGRGMAPSRCVLVSDRLSDVSKQRLDAMVNTTDGFELAELDLRLRGPGEVLGVKQSGLPQFKVADLVQDEPLLILARKVAIKIMAKDPDLSGTDWQPLKKWLLAAAYLYEEGRLN